ncbi:MAG: hypothetical protein AB7J86_41830 [Vulcanimicrobiota bacterium]
MKRLGLIHYLVWTLLVSLSLPVRSDSICPACSIGGVTLGMTPGQVLSMLGEPTERVGNENWTVWEYAEGQNVLAVHFHNFRNPALRPVYPSLLVDRNVGLQVSAVSGYSIDFGPGSSLTANSAWDEIVAKLGTPTGEIEYPEAKLVYWEGFQAYLTHGRVKYYVFGGFSQ